MFLFAMLFCVSWACAAPLPFTAEVEQEFPGIPWRSVALVRIEGERAHHIYHSGFFIAEDRLVVANSPFAKNKTKACENPTWIFAGARSLVADFDVKKMAPTHRCKKVLKDDRLRGYAIWELEAREKDSVTIPIPLLTEEGVDKYRLELELERFTYLGFAFGEKESTLKISRRCAFKVFSGPFAMGTVEEGVWDHRWDWSSLKCDFESGMQGGPLLVRAKGKWFAVGMGVALTEVSGVPQAPLLSTNFPRVTGFFGETLEAEE